VPLPTWHCYAIEIEPAFVDGAIRRFAAATCKEAILDGEVAALVAPLLVLRTRVLDPQRSSAASRHPRKRLPKGAAPIGARSRFLTRRRGRCLP
jgi:hypothetical protein